MKRHGCLLTEYNITGRNIVKFLKDSGVSSQKTTLQAKIFQNSEEERMIHHRNFSQKHEPTQNEPSKDWKNTRLSWGGLKQ